ncbi:MAG: CDP-diacylglycerol--glycerol-3-phosphate 3-phosphatidyltransferase [Saccharofermentanaceae bacterium]|jgi:CDP-diacylglycerol--glycerol-3-phosphate 3-phosphatidyltransferase/cardiolipin synthase|nr:CDP-diacylglycerol--glycerol-3-phosphate 3-phosphatidyltransferase [Clostridia bacterium]NLX67931.1 CDP-diacylglycerol--glycerol-3-phosphate 3-phosphatidyltransferase [Clostridiaceae bacterium]HOO48447.1 CDP-diacylglycerol--glycerol-3-phosphate 3-phosphatidyltransferase [Saccharofermentans sp.]HPE27418.1 CDP-diacylglycerol--glycerol-3-phosphate 3-phosphatidyltransferase [Saccharofermentans sp.]HPM74457.1 CDP-diacylglycerol--glycerol-3-phosphate 3-phosphatidyltransferase [Saccharofermentans s
MNLPNKLSILRIILIPVTLVFMLPISIYGFEPAGWNNFIGNYGMLIAAFIFIIASLTDMADGKIARKYNLITNLGKFLDSLADKMLIIGVLIAFVGLGRISAWLLMIIVLREFMVTGIRMLASEKGVVMAAKMIGKVKTTTQMIAVIYLMFEPTIMKIFNISSSKINPVTIVGDVLFGICVIMTVVSGLDYLLKNLNFLKES